MFVFVMVAAICILAVPLSRLRSGPGQTTPTTLTNPIVSRPYSGAPVPRRMSASGKGHRSSKSEHVNTTSWKTQESRTFTGDGSTNQARHRPDAWWVKDFAEDEKYTQNYTLAESLQQTVNVSVPVAAGSVPTEQHHVFFLKVHKAASTTMMNVMYRFALSHHLNVMLPKTGSGLSQTSKAWAEKVAPLPPGVPRFDILCNHVVFNESTVRAFLYPDAVFIGIVRNPFDQFLSAFNYYTSRFSIKYLMRIPGKDPVSTYLSDPLKWELPDVHQSYTHNRMSFDFGLEPDEMTDAEYVARFITYLNDTFDLVLVSERFDESMILMKRKLGWRMKDVIYIKSNAFHHKKRRYTDEQRRTHRRFNMADYALYEHFSRLFDKRVTAKGKSFAAEVQTYKSVLQTIAKFCMSEGKQNLVVRATDWNEEFLVSRTNCTYMTLREPRIAAIMRRSLMPRPVE